MCLWVPTVTRVMDKERLVYGGVLISGSSRIVTTGGGGTGGGGTGGAGSTGGTGGSGAGGGGGGFGGSGRRGPGMVKNINFIFYFF